MRTADKPARRRRRPAAGIPPARPAGTAGGGSPSLPGDGRRHVRARVALFPLLWLDVITGDALLVLEHLVMFPLMYLVMRCRRAEYGGSSHG
jgi:hypothetical protein